VALKHLLVHLDSTEHAVARLDLAVALADRFGAVLTAVFAESAQLEPSVVTMRDPARMEAALAETRAAFEARVSAARLPSEWWQVDRGDYGHTVGWVVRCCRYSDMAILGRHDPTGARVPRDLVEQVLLGSGRPVLMVPSGAARAGIGARVLVAWTASREAARAVNDAIPLMVGAEDVIVLSLQNPGDAGDLATPPLDIVAHLNAHGVPARYERSIVDERSAVQVLLSRAEEMGIDLVVVGGHPQTFPLLQLSRTTREIIRSTSRPLLLSS
jgi:nucleotide-binding universal stress UspA family protein